MSTEKNITVCVKVRPLLKQEKVSIWCIKDNALQQVDNPRGDNQERFYFGKKILILIFYFPLFIRRGPTRCADSKTAIYSHTPV